MDPLAADYAAWSPYHYTLDNPIRFIDPDGRAPDDIVYFNREGQEIHRIKSNTIFKTYVANQSSMTAPAASVLSQYQDSPVHDRFFTEAAMPNIIQNRNSGGNSTAGAAYQANDYAIAAQTLIFNQEKANGNLSLVTDGGNSISSSAISNIPNLDPTLVKAIAMQESHVGVDSKTSDIMQINNKGDWDSEKSNLGLSYGVKPNVSTSLYAGIRFLATKGFRGGVTYDKGTGNMTFTFQGWSSAIQEYNGGGVSGYQGNVLRMINQSTTPTPQDY